MSTTTNAVTVMTRVDADVIARHVTCCTVVIEQARGTSFFGETGQPRGFWNLFSVSGKSPLAQADTAEALVRWAKKNGAKRAEVLS